eukprot:gb/GEZN01002853.1/.p1 GENE.gb/GEZN01002853.1/~~gb/GEZN01002853.1/.p1  ORF type:complete len:698 (-),score=76.29 gb/GEZN01002853.1/:143-2236(-)
MSAMEDEPGAAVLSESEGQPPSAVGDVVGEVESRNGLISSPPDGSSAPDDSSALPSLPPPLSPHADKSVITVTAAAATVSETETVAEAKPETTAEKTATVEGTTETVASKTDVTTKAGTTTAAETKATKVAAAKGATEAASPTKSSSAAYNKYGDQPKLFIPDVVPLTTEQFAKGMAQYGRVADAVVMPGGFGFCTYETSEGTDAALDAGEVIIDERRFAIEKAKPKRSRVPPARDPHYASPSGRRGRSGPIEEPKLYIGNLPAITTTAEFHSALSQFGRVSDCVVMKGGFGFCTFESPDGSDNALRGTLELHGRVLSIEHARPKEGQQPVSGGRSGRPGSGGGRPGSGGGWGLGRGGGGNGRAGGGIGGGGVMRRGERGPPRRYDRGEYDSRNYSPPPSPRGARGRAYYFDDYDEDRGYSGDRGYGSRGDRYERSYSGERGYGGERERSRGRRSYDDEPRYYRGERSDDDYVPPARSRDREYDRDRDAGGSYGSRGYEREEPAYGGGGGGYDYAPAPRSHRSREPDRFHPYARGAPLLDRGAPREAPPRSGTTMPPRTSVLPPRTTAISPRYPPLPGADFPPPRGDYPRTPRPETSGEFPRSAVRLTTSARSAPPDYGGSYQSSPPAGYAGASSSNGSSSNNYLPMGLGSSTNVYAGSYATTLAASDSVGNIYNSGSTGNAYATTGNGGSTTGNYM